jgi:epoxyqueuosine reductase
MPKKRLKNATRLAEEIRARALELGYDKCALLPLSRLSGFGDEVDSRLRRVPEDDYKGADRAVLEKFSFFRRLPEAYPFARSVAICVMNYGVYEIPAHLKERVGRSFCVDSRLDSNSREYRASVAFEEFLASLGIVAETERRYGLLPLRLAASLAGLGRGRKNNFFYAKSGSWIHLEAWLIDQDLELTETSDLPLCPPNCELCQKACPTGALAGDYLTRPAKCLTFINAVNPVNWVDHPYSEAAGGWIYGCDACQSACPFNKGKWREELEFPGLADIAENLHLPRLVEMSHESLKANFSDKFWYVSPDRVWQWKANALNAMKNSWSPDFRPALKKALGDESPEVRRVAEWVKSLIKARA